jgi:hypothetical protein
VVDYLPIGRGATDTALLLRIKTADGGHAFQLLADRSAPASARTVFTNQGFLEGVLVSTDLRYAAWIDPDFRGSVIRVGDGTSCALNAGAAPPVGDLSFLDDAGLVLWTEPFAGAYARRDGFLSPPDRCAERVRFARGLGFFAPVGHRGLIIGDEKDETSRTVTLKYASLGGAASADAGPVWPSQGPVRIQARVQTPVTFVGTDTLYLLYRAEAQGPRAAGLYLFGPVPF